MKSYLLFIVSALLVAGYSGKNLDCGPLCDYVWAPDDHYKYELIETQRGVAVTLYTLNMTSQKWFDGNNQI